MRILCRVDAYFWRICAIRMKRFTATEKWSKEWFQDLSLVHKLLWYYLFENCDQAGVWDPNWREAGNRIGEKVSAKDMEVFGDRVKLLSSGKWHLTTFVEFQYGKLSPNAKVHQSVIRCLERHGIESVRNGIPMGLESLQGKGTVKEEGGDVRGGSAIGPELPLIVAHGATLHPPAPPDFCEWFHNDREAAGWIGRDGVPIMRWKNALASAWSGYQHRLQERAAKAGNGKPYDPSRDPKKRMRTPAEIYGEENL